MGSGAANGPAKLAVQNVQRVESWLNLDISPNPAAHDTFWSRRLDAVQSQSNSSVTACGPAPNPQEAVSSQSFPVDLQGSPFFTGVSLLFYLGRLFTSLQFSSPSSRVLTLHLQQFVPTIQSMLWASGTPSTIGLLLIGMDLAFMLPVKRRRVAIPFHFYLASLSAPLFLLRTMMRQASVML